MQNKRILIKLLLAIGCTQSALAMEPEENQNRQIEEVREIQRQRWLQQNAPAAPAVPVAQPEEVAVAEPVAPVIENIPLVAEAPAVQATLSIQDLLDQGEELEILNGRLSLDHRNLTSLEGLQNFMAPEAVTNLDISNNALTTIPNGIFNRFVNLTVLDLSHNRLEALPEHMLDQTANLEFLNCSFNLLTSLPQDLCLGLFRLGYAEFENNKLTDSDMQVLRNCIDLRVIDFSNNLITSVPAALLKRFTKLDDLWLDGNKIASLPSETVAIIKQRPIFVSKLLAHIGEEHTPRTVTGLVAELHTQGKIQDIFHEDQDAGGYIIDLRSRCLTDMDDLAEALPESLAHHVVAIYASGNYLTKIPFKCLMNYPRLKSLYLSNNQITSLAEMVEVEVNNVKQVGMRCIGACGLTELETLGLSHNQITHIPTGSLRGLTSLRWLYLDHNNINAIEKGAICFHLRQLESCTLNNNQLTTFDEFFGREYKITSLNLSHNNLGNSKLRIHKENATITLLPQSPQPLKLVVAKRLAEIIKIQEPVAAIETLLSYTQDLIDCLVMSDNGLDLSDRVKRACIVKQTLEKLSTFPCNLPDNDFASSGAQTIWFNASNRIALELMDSLEDDPHSFALYFGLAIKDITSIFDCLSKTSPLCKRLYAYTKTAWIQLIKNASIIELTRQHPLDIMMFLLNGDLLRSDDSLPMDLLKAPDVPQYILEKVQKSNRVRIGLLSLEKQKETLFEMLSAEEEPIEIEEISTKLQQNFAQTDKDELHAFYELASPQLLDLLALMGIRDPRLRQISSDNSDAVLTLQSHGKGK